MQNVLAGVSHQGELNLQSRFARKNQDTRSRETSHPAGVRACVCFDIT
jgi:hypothetical protein